MAARGSFRGHPIVFEGAPETGRWVYADTGEPTAETWRERPCGHCGEYATDQGHDACLGCLPGVANACCGHGARDESYIQFTNGVLLKGFTIERRASTFNP